jgi:hypothetical protein
MHGEPVFDTLERRLVLLACPIEKHRRGKVVTAL